MKLVVGEDAHPVGMAPVAMSISTVPERRYGGSGKKRGREEEEGAERAADGERELCDASSALQTGRPIHTTSRQRVLSKRLYNEPNDSASPFIVLQRRQLRSAARPLYSSYAAQHNWSGVGHHCHLAARI